MLSGLRVGFQGCPVSRRLATTKRNGRTSYMFRKTGFATMQVQQLLCNNTLNTCVGIQVTTTKIHQSAHLHGYPDVLSCDYVLQFNTNDKSCGLLSWMRCELQARAVWTEMMI